jgi:hypothetical protein
LASGARDSKSDFEIIAAVSATTASRPLRFVLIGDHLIAYAPDEKPLWLVAVMHGRRRSRVMAAILKSSE